MNVVVIGSGGREHALALKLSQSPTLKNLYILPGNPGTELCGKNVDIKISDKEALLQFCISNNIDLVVIGPEAPLVDGLGNYLRKHGINVFGPNKNAARIESEKSFAKKLMTEYNVPTANYKEFSFDQYEDAKKYLEKIKYPVVLKADGLAAGKGVLICEDKVSAIKGVDEILISKKFGDAGNKLIVEEFLKGEEASIFAITDGKDYVCLPSSQDHKRIGENDTGLNTGGMGAYSPAPIVTDEILEKIKINILEPVINALRKEGNEFIGCLYAGLMITPEGPKVIEFNCRFGDPETQAVLPLLEGDFLQLLYSAARGQINKTIVNYNGGCSICVIAASSGYPGSYENGYEIEGLNKLMDESVIIYHAGTKKENNKIVTNGGRVLGVTSFLDNVDFKKAQSLAYNSLANIYFEGIYFRMDIAHKVLQ